MAVEIERKFLVRNNKFMHLATNKLQIVQGFLNSDTERMVRVRIKDGEGFLTIKGKPELSGITRFEWEKQISEAEARQLMTLCEPGTIEKTRYLVPHEEYIFEVDVFLGENSGLVIAEVELPSPSHKLIIPDWIGKEVTGRKEYYNAYLSKNPFTSWT